MSRDLVAVSARLHPLKVEYKSLTVPYGTSIQDILWQVGVTGALSKYVRVECGGIEIEPRWWSRVYPHASVTIRVVPQDSGGGEKNPIRTIALLGVTLLGGGIARSVRQV